MNREDRELARSLSVDELKDQLRGLKIQIQGGWGDPARLSYQAMVMESALREKIGRIKLDEFKHKELES